MTLLEPFLDGQVAAIMPQYIADEQDLALLLASSGDLTQAAELSGRALAQTQKIVGSSPRTDSQRGSLAQSCSIRALVQARIGQAAEAQQAAASAVRIWDEIKSYGVLSQYRQQIPTMDQLFSSPTANP
jgi:hypothetical protein